MARDFQGGYFHIGTGLSAPTTLSVALWTHIDTLSGYWLNCHNGSSPFNGWSYRLFSTVADKPSYWSNNIGTWQNGTTSLTTGEWLHVGFSITGTGAGGGTHYLNGAANGTWTHSHPSAYVGANHAIGAFNSGIVLYDGRMAEFGIWNAGLTATEFASLADGLAPPFIRPANLIRYWPFIADGSPAIERKNGISTTLVSGTVAVSSHPRIIYPAAPHIITVPAVVAAGANPKGPFDNPLRGPFGGPV
jgi:hypothetical protein